MTDAKELRKLAREAAVIDHNEREAWYTADELMSGCSIWYPKNARHIAAQSPAVTIELLEKIEAQAAEIERLRVEFAAYKEGSELAFGHVVEQKKALEAQVPRFEETIRSQGNVICSMRNRLAAVGLPPLEQS